jgi:hypothetical protein
LWGFIPSRSRRSTECARTEEGGGAGRWARRPPLHPLPHFAGSTARKCRGEEYSEAAEAEEFYFSRGGAVEEVGERRKEEDFGLRGPGFGGEKAVGSSSSPTTSSARCRCATI